MGAYIRKTRDEWEILGNYGYGWDVECTEATAREARERLREYRDNGTGVYRLVKRRVTLRELFEGM